MPQTIQYDAAHIALGSRFFDSSTVAASPTAGTITTICSVTIGGDLAVTKAVYLVGFAAFTAGTNGVSATLQIRQTDTVGTSLVSTGAVTVVAASLYAQTIVGIDASPLSATQVYVMTLTVGSASAASTVSQARLVAVVV